MCAELTLCCTPLLQVRYYGTSIFFIYFSLVTANTHTTRDATRRDARRAESGAGCIAKQGAGFRRSCAIMSDRRSTRVKTVAKAFKRVDEDTRRQVRVDVFSDHFISIARRMPTFWFFSYLFAAFILDDGLTRYRTPSLRPADDDAQVAAARLDALENDNAEAEGGDGDDSEYEIEEAEGKLYATATRNNQETTTSIYKLTNHTKTNE